MFSKTNKASASLKIILALLLVAPSLSACGLFGSSGDGEGPGMLSFGDKGAREADLAVVAYTQGHFDEADDHVRESLHDNKRNAQALLVGALLSEKTNRPNRARQFYEEILLYNGNEVSVLGATTNKAEKITDIARKRLRQLNLKQNKLIVEDAQGNKVFNMGAQASAQNNTTVIKRTLVARQKQAPVKSTTKDVDALFSDAEKNTIARFIILKELAENDLITKEEFLRARQTNIGGLLPLTQIPPSSQVVKPVPTASIIIDRINALKSALEDREITTKEFTAERNLIVEAVLPPRPVERLKRKAPARDIITAAKDLRKLEVIYDLNLITSNEKAKERAAIEESLGLKTGGEPVQESIIPAIIDTPQPQPASNLTVKEVIRVVEPETAKVEEITIVPASNTIPANKPTEEVQPLLPNVSSPFNK